MGMKHIMKRSLQALVTPQNVDIEFADVPLVM